MRGASPPNSLRKLPAGWVIAILCGLMLYAIIQPILRDRWGWQLPSIAALPGQADDARKTETQSQAARPREADNQREVNAQHEAAPKEIAPTEVLQSDHAKAGDKLLHGVLREIASGRWVSPAGLLYAPGSEEGHRLKHLERHLTDQPDRPGKHGVFRGDMSQVLLWIDDAYTRARRNEKGTRKNKQGDRIVYEAPFDTAIGFIGGREGARDKNPPARRLRLVVEGQQFVTAFPF